MDIRETVEKLINDKLENFTLSDTMGQRTIGDKIEYLCSFIVANEYPDNYIESRSKRSTEDFTLLFDNETYYFDVKTHFIQEVAGFSMPNLASIEKLRNLLKEDDKSLLYIFVDYKRVGDSVTIEGVNVRYLWELDWSMLGIGALGKGQLQIKNANNDLVFCDIGKEKWYELLLENGYKYNENQLIKIEREMKKWI